MANEKASGFKINVLWLLSNAQFKGWCNKSIAGFIKKPGN